MNWVEVVETTARNMGGLDEQGRLKALDSLTLIDFIVELESAGNVEIPSDALRADTFASVESVAQLLATLKR